LADQVPAGVVDLLHRTYAAFNERDVGAVLGTLHPDVDWPNVREGTRVHGHEGVRSYWRQQFAQIDPRVEPVRISAEPDGRVAVEVHQVIRDLGGNVLTEQTVQHVYTFRDGLVERMDVRPGPDPG
jgi:ketosteroid isomerase-like protein